MRRLVELTAYPIVTAATLLGFEALVAAGASHWTAAYVTVALGYLCIAAHEILHPERPEWRPDRREFFTDVAYLGLVQVLLPQFLALAAAIALAGVINTKGTGIGGLWPHHWSPWAQLLLLTVAAELPRYWLHRLFHTIGPLWRFHAVHHAPRIIYSVNVGRFHPVDKALQFVAEILPFIVLGVATEVMALYFVFYAVTGFYQHANCRIRLGFLNWIIAGPELHRWHHSLEAREALTNYGNKLIVWDMVFGTRFLPRDRLPERLGIDEPDYPTSFLAQMTAPFTKRPGGT